MSTVRPAQASEAYGGSEPRYDDRGDGWVLFAGIMLLLVGCLNVIDGIAAVSNSSFFVDDARYIISGLNTLGWIVLLLGAAQILAAFGVWAKTPGVRWFGVAIALCNAIAQLLLIPAYPFWSLTLFTVDILIIYGLVAHGKRSYIS
jgi:hypothetical protein